MSDDSIKEVGAQEAAFGAIGPVFQQQGRPQRSWAPTRVVLPHRLPYSGQQHVLQQSDCQVRNEPAVFFSLSWL